MASLPPMHSGGASSTPCDPRFSIGTVADKSPSAHRFNNAKRLKTDAAVCRFFYANNLAFNTTTSLTFKEMIHEVVKAGDGYVFRGVKHVSGDGIVNEKARLITKNAELRREVLDEFGCTLASDGKADVNGNPLINVMLVHKKGVEHVDTFNCATISKKTGIFMRVLLGAYLCEEDYDPDDDDAMPAVAQGEDDEDEEEIMLSDLKLITEKVIKNKDVLKVAAEKVVQIILDGASVCKKALRLLQHKFPHIYVTIDITHSLDLALEDIGALEWVKEIVDTVKELFFLIKHHDATSAAFRTLTPLKLKTPNDTRFKYQVTMLQRCKRLKTELDAVFSLPAFVRWQREQSGNMQAKIREIREEATDPNFYHRVDFLLDVMQPVSVLLTKTETFKPFVVTFMSTCLNSPRDMTWKATWVISGRMQRARRKSLR